jgi:5-methyltetrahydrofolate--homocysteine methyltransferase
MSRPQHLHSAAQPAKDNRKRTPISEAALWSRIHRRQLDYRFRRQVPVGPWIADFACLHPKVVIEVDGESHDYRDEPARTAYLESQGFTIIGLNNEDVTFDHGELTEWLKERIREIVELESP